MSPEARPLVQQLHFLPAPDTPHEGAAHAVMGCQEVTCLYRHFIASLYRLADTVVLSSTLVLKIQASCPPQVTYPVTTVMQRVLQASLNYSTQLMFLSLVVLQHCLPWQGQYFVPGLSPLFAFYFFTFCFWLCALLICLFWFEMLFPAVELGS